MLNHPQPAADRPARAVAAIIGLTFLSAVWFVVALAGHQSRHPVVFGRYSWPLAALLLAAALVLGIFGLGLLRFRARWQRALYDWLLRLPADVVVVAVLAVGTGLAWLHSHPPFRFVASAGFWAASLSLGLAATASLMLRSRVIGPEPAALAGAWSLLCGVVAALLAAHFRASLHLVRLTAVGSLLAGYVLFRAAWTLTRSRERLTADQPPGRARRPLWMAASLAIVLAAFTLALYRPALQHQLLLNDEILMVNHAVTHPGLTAIVQPATTVLFRPLFQLQAWLDYSLFGLNHAGYVLIQLGLVWLSALALFGLAAKLSGSLFLGGLLAASVLAHRFVADLVSVWAIDTMAVNALVAVLVVAWQAYQPDSRRYYAALGLLLLLGCLSRENGLVTVGAVAVGALLRLRQPAAHRPRARRELAVTLLVLAAYLTLRRLWVSPGVLLFIQDTCLGSELYLGQAIAAWSPVQQAWVVAYTSAANLIAPLVPALFTGLGCLAPGAGAAWLLMLGVVVAVWLSHTAEQGLAPAAAPERRAGGLALAALIGPGGAILVAAAPALVVLGHSERLDLFLQGALTLLLLLALARQHPPELAPRLVTANVLGAWLVGALVFGLYFRYRNFILLLFGWALLVALAWGGQGSPRRSLRAAFALLLSALLVLGVGRTSAALPKPFLLAQNFSPTNLICWPGISDAFAVQWGRYYALEAEVAGCRARARCNPDAAQLPFNEGSQSAAAALPADCAVAAP